MRHIRALNPIRSKTPLLHPMYSKSCLFAPPMHSFTSKAREAEDAAAAAEKAARPVNPAERPGGWRANVHSTSDIRKDPAVIKEAHKREIFSSFDKRGFAQAVSKYKEPAKLSKGRELFMQEMSQSREANPIKAVRGLRKRFGTLFVVQFYSFYALGFLAMFYLVHFMGYLKPDFLLKVFGVGWLAKDHGMACDVVTAFILNEFLEFIRFPTLVLIHSFIRAP